MFRQSSEGQLVFRVTQDRGKAGGNIITDKSGFICDLQYVAAAHHIASEKMGSLVNRHRERREKNRRKSKHDRKSQKILFRRAVDKRDCHDRQNNDHEPGHEHDDAETVFFFSFHLCCRLYSRRRISLRLPGGRHTALVIKNIPRIADRLRLLRFALKGKFLAYLSFPEAVGPLEVRDVICK